MEAKGGEGVKSCYSKAGKLNQKQVGCSSLREIEGDFDFIRIIKKIRVREIQFNPTLTV